MDNKNQAGIGIELIPDIEGFKRKLDRLPSIPLKMDTEPLGRFSRQASEFQKSLAASQARVLAFSATAGQVYGLMRAFDALVKTTINVEKQLTDINVLFNLSQKQLSIFSNELFKVASQTGQSFKTAAGAALEFSRQGLSVQETLKRTKDALTLVRLGGGDVNSAVTTLTATINAFNDVSLDSTAILNKLANVDAQFAVSVNDLSQALGRAGSSAKDMGVSFETLIGLITSAKTITGREGAVIGNALKSIFQRIERPQVLQQIRELGVLVEDYKGEALSADKILVNLAKTYDHLSASQKNQVVQMAAGVFQANQFRAILSDLSKENSIASRASQAAANAGDVAAKRQMELNKTLSAQINETMNNIANASSKIGKLTLGPTITTLLKGANLFTTPYTKLGADQGESFGGIIGQGLLRGIGNYLSGPGLALIGVLMGKFMYNFATYTAKSLTTIIEANSKRYQQEQVIQNLIAREPGLYAELVKLSGDQAAIQARITQSLYAQIAAAGKLAAIQSAGVAGMEKTMGPFRTQGGMFYVNSKDSLSPNPNYKPKAVGLIPAANEAMGAIEGGYIPGEIKNMTVPGMGNVVYNSAETVKQFPGMSQPAIMPPKTSPAGQSYQKQFQVAHGFNPYAAKGLIPNFAFDSNIFVNFLRNNMSLERLSQQANLFTSSEKVKGLIQNDRSGMGRETLNYALTHKVMGRPIGGDTYDLLQHYGISPALLDILGSSFGKQTQYLRNAINAGEFDTYGNKGIIPNYAVLPEPIKDRIKWRWDAQGEEEDSIRDYQATYWKANSIGTGSHVSTIADFRGLGNDRYEFGFGAGRGPISKFSMFRREVPAILEEFSKKYHPEVIKTIPTSETRFRIYKRMLDKAGIMYQVLEKAKGEKMLNIFPGGPLARSGGLIPNFAYIPFISPAIGKIATNITHSGSGFGWRAFDAALQKLQEVGFKETVKLILKDKPLYRKYDFFGADAEQGNYGVSDFAFRKMFGLEPRELPKAKLTQVGERRYSIDKKSIQDNYPNHVTGTHIKDGKLRGYSRNADFGNYTVEYDPRENKIKFWDTWDFAPHGKTGGGLKDALSEFGGVFGLKNLYKDVKLGIMGKQAARDEYGDLTGNVEPLRVGRKEYFKSLFSKDQLKNRFFNSFRSGYDSDAIKSTYEPEHTSYGSTVFTHLLRRFASAISSPISFTGEMDSSHFYFNQLVEYLRNDARRNGATPSQLAQLAIPVKGRQRYFFKDELRHIPLTEELIGPRNFYNATRDTNPFTHPYLSENAPADWDDYKEKQNLKFAKFKEGTLGPDVNPFLSKGYIPNYAQRLGSGIFGSFWDLERIMGGVNAGAKIFKKRVSQGYVDKEFDMAQKLENLDINPLFQFPKTLGRKKRVIFKELFKGRTVGDLMFNQRAIGDSESMLIKQFQRFLEGQLDSQGIIMDDVVGHSGNTLLNDKALKLIKKMSEKEDSFSKLYSKMTFNPSIIGQIASAMARQGARLGIVDPGEFKIKRADGLVPSFSLSALSSAISREMGAGISSAQVRVGSSSALISSQNPMGLGVYNTQDEPMGLNQGINRVAAMGLDPKKAGVPNFAEVRMFDKAGGGSLTPKQSVDLQKEIDKLKTNIKSTVGQYTKAQLEDIVSQLNKKLTPEEGERVSREVFSVWDKKYKPNMKQWTGGTIVDNSIYNPKKKITGAPVAEYPGPENPIEQPEELSVGQVLSGVHNSVPAIKTKLKEYVERVQHGLLDPASEAAMELERTIMNSINKMGDLTPSMQEFKKKSIQKMHKAQDRGKKVVEQRARDDEARIREQQKAEIEAEAFRIQKEREQSIKNAEKVSRRWENISWIDMLTAGHLPTKGGKEYRSAMQEAKKLNLTNIPKERWERLGSKMLTASFVMPMLTGIAEQGVLSMTGGESTKTRGTARLVGALGNVASFGATGAGIAGPWGALAGTALGLATETASVVKAFTDTLPDLERHIEKLKDSTQKTTTSIAGYIELTEKLGEVYSGKLTGLTKGQVNELQNQQIKQFLSIPDKELRDQFTKILKEESDIPRARELGINYTQMQQQKLEAGEELMSVKQFVDKEIPEKEQIRKDAFIKVLASKQTPFRMNDWRTWVAYRGGLNPFEKGDTQKIQDEYKNELENPARMEEYKSRIASTTSKLFGLTNKEGTTFLDYLFQNGKLGGLEDARSRGTTAEFIKGVGKEGGFSAVAIEDLSNALSMFLSKDLTKPLAQEMISVKEINKARESLEEFIVSFAQGRIHMEDFVQNLVKSEVAFRKLQYSVDKSNLGRSLSIERGNVISQTQQKFANQLLLLNSNPYLENYFNREEKMKENRDQLKSNLSNLGRETSSEVMSILGVTRRNLSNTIFKDFVTGKGGEDKISNEQRALLNQKREDIQRMFESSPEFQNILKITKQGSYSGKDWDQIESFLANQLQIADDFKKIGNQFGTQIYTLAANKKFDPLTYLNMPEGQEVARKYGASDRIIDIYRKRFEEVQRTGGKMEDYRNAAATADVQSDLSSITADTFREALLSMRDVRYKYLGQRQTIQGNAEIGALDIGARYKGTDKLLGARFANQQLIQNVTSQLGRQDITTQAALARQAAVAKPLNAIEIQAQAEFKGATSQLLRGNQYGLLQATYNNNIGKLLNPDYLQKEINKTGADRDALRATGNIKAADELNGKLEQLVDLQNNIDEIQKDINAKKKEQLEDEKALLNLSENRVSDLQRRIINAAAQGKFSAVNPSEALLSGFKYTSNDLYKDSMTTLSTFADTFKSTLADAFGSAINSTDSFTENLRKKFLDMASGYTARFAKMGIDSILGAAFKGLGVEKLFGPGQKYGGPIKFSQGGFVNMGSGVKDDVPAFLSGGEFVLNKQATQRAGINNLNAINNSMGALNKDYISTNGNLTTMRFANIYAIMNPTDESKIYGKWIRSKSLSSYAMTDENNPMNRLNYEKEHWMFNQYERLREHQKEVKNFENNQKMQMGMATLSAAATIGMGFAMQPPSAPDYSGETPFMQEFNSNKEANFFNPYLNRANNLGFPYSRGGYVPRFMGGGYFGGDSIGDRYPAMLMGGEFVVNPQSVSSYGKSFFEKLNRGYADGGYVGNSYSGTNSYNSQEPLRGYLDASVSVLREISAKLGNKSQGKNDNNSNQSSGGIVNNVNITITMDKSGSPSTAKTNTTTTGKENNDTDKKELEKLSNNLEAAVIAILNKQMKHGGVITEKMSNR